MPRTAHLRRALSVLAIMGAAASAAPASTTPADARTQPTPIEQLSDDLTLYSQHINTLANPFMEGRAPGTNGNRVAASYVEFYFKKYGLQPAFPAAMGQIPLPKETVAPNGERASWRQVFVAPRGALRPGEGIVIHAQELNWQAPNPNGMAGAANVLTVAKDFNPLGTSGKGNVTAGLAFAGYSIKTGDKDYTSYPEGASLAGKIAIVLRFEPMDEKGTSKWGDGSWSFRAALEPKLRAAVEKGAAGIILVNPPGADDERTKKLEGMNLGGRLLDVPAVMMSIDAADAMIRAADSQGRGLLDLRKLADENGGPIDLPNAQATLNVDIERVPVYTDNVGGILPGKGNLADQFIVIGAHYDHVGYGYFGSRGLGEDVPKELAKPTEPGAAAAPTPPAAERRSGSAAGMIHPGADDNASGTSGILILAKKLTEAYAQLPADANARSILFMTFSAEESGLNGSRFYTNNPIVPLDQHYLMINCDMIGRLRTEPPMELGGVASGSGLKDWIKPYIDGFGQPVIQRDSGQGPSDHASFDSKDIPVLFFFTGLHTEYHRPSDIASLINTEGAVKIADLVQRIALDVAQRPEPMPHKNKVPTKSPSSDEQPAKDKEAQAAAGPVGGVRVRFGIMPDNYGDDNKGVKIGDVFPNTTADKAGLKKGDLMTKWGDKLIETVDDWMPLLRDHNPGDKVLITFKRDGKEMTTEAILQGRNAGPQ